MKEYLAGFEKRMGFAAVVDSIVNRRNRSNEIEDWFAGEELDNIFFSLLVYVMEQTLSENDRCTMEDMGAFLDDILPDYGKQWPFDKVMTLAEYMVKDILQNKGVMKSYGIMDYGRGMIQYPVRLISDKITEDNRIVYQLTDQGYDFLFRTKEVDKELDFKLEQLKLKELLKRKNYKHAQKQSRELINMLRQKKHEIEDFINRTKQNINTIDRGEHEKLLRETYALLDEEYQGMLELKEAVDKDGERINKELAESGYVDEAVGRALDNLNSIKRNLLVVINEQRNLIGKRFNMNDIYEETIRNSFYAAIVKRYDFRKEIMEPLEKINGEAIGNLWQLLTPLLKPNPKKYLGLSLIYGHQGKLRESEEEEIRPPDEIFLEDEAVRKRKDGDAMNVCCVNCIFKFAAESGGEYTLSQLYAYIKEVSSKFESYMTDKRLFLIILKLYDYGCVDVAGWKAGEDREVPETNGEFDLSYCLHQLGCKHPEYYGIEQLWFEKTGDKFRIEIEEKSETAAGILEIVTKTIIMDEIRVTAAGKERWDGNA